MAIRRRQTDKDATWTRAWTVDTWAELAQVPAKHGDVAFCVQTGKWHSWRDDGSWPEDGGSGDGAAAQSFGNLDGGTPTSVYGGVASIDAGGP